MAVPNTNTFSLWDVCTEIYGSHSAGMNLVQCFTDATGTFDPLYHNNIDNGLRQLSEFRNYKHTLGLVYDYDGNPYQPIRIGSQIWLNSDFHCTHFTDGTVIPFKDSYDIISPDFNNTSVAYTNTDYLSQTTTPFYYNAGAAFMTKQLAIPGWHVPTLNDLNTLASNLGGSAIAGGKMKNSSDWNSPNTGSDNSSGFTGKGNGIINGTAWNYHNQQMWFWLSDLPVSGIYTAALLSYNLASLNTTSALAKYGLTVRLIKD